VSDNRILVIGGDLRQHYATEYILNNGFLCSSLDGYNKVQEQIDGAKYILLPLPFTRDNVYINDSDIKIDDFLQCDMTGKTLFLGAIKDNMKNRLKGINYIDYYNDDEFAKLNAIPTSEGSIECIIRNTVITICNSEVLITGYGRVAKDLAKRLKALGANITIAVRKKEQSKMARLLGYNTVNILEIGDFSNKFDIAVNTPNAYIFTEKLYRMFKKDTMFLDLASAPGGFNFKTENYENIFVERGLPVLTAPKTAGEYLAKTIIKYILEG